MELIDSYNVVRKDLNGISEKYKYTGKEKDITGLYYYGARYYNPEIGRFTTRDPEEGDIMNPQSFRSIEHISSYYLPFHVEDFWKEIRFGD
ncbi:MAG TPA: hypothetical protein ENI50_01580 [Euryarchaeota archaeon]|nr:hypothetical protein [Euryarchaeota archaeon]